jgi:hypothetical protein
MQLVLLLHWKLQLFAGNDVNMYCKMFNMEVKWCKTNLLIFNAKGR